MNEQAVDVVALCETRISPKCALAIQGYTCLRQDKRTDGKGQGIAFFIKTDISYSILNIPPTQQIECLGISITLSGKEVALVSAYQSPNQPLLPRDIDVLLNLKSSVLIMGDLNAKHPYWNCTKINDRGLTLFDHMINNDYDVIAPSVPTLVHYCGDYTPSNPDVLICKNCYDVSELLALEKLSSNHLPVLFSVDGSFTRKKIIQYRYSEANWLGYKSYLNRQINLTAATYKSPADIDSAILGITELINGARDRFVPHGSIKTGPAKLPKFIKAMISDKNRLRTRALSEDDPFIRRILFSQVNYLQRTIKSTLKSYNDNLWNAKLESVDNPTADLWRVVKSLGNRSVTIPPLKDNNGCLTTNAQEQCEVLANAFSQNMLLTNNWVSDPETEAKVKRSVEDLDTFEGPFSINPVSPREVGKTLRKLKRRKAPGYDNLTNILLKHLPQKAIVLLTKIFNNCLKFYYFPNAWKQAKVITIKKPGKDDSIPQNYRPISLLPALGKLFESVIASRLLKVIHNKLIPEQFGFRQCHSTVQQLTRVAEHVTHKLNLGQSTGMILLDIEKAFDSVWHNGLLHKLIKMEVPMQLVKLIQSYLSDRTFFVKIDKDASKPYHIPAGVPQGSILGPHLFLVYINDIIKQPHTLLASFADDTACFTSSDDIDSIITRLQWSFDTLTNFFTTWKLKLNVNKTEAILFSRLRSLPCRKIKVGDNETIPWSKSVKYLGTILDDKLNWSLNSTELHMKGIKALNALSPIMNRRSNLSSKTKLRIYSTLVRPCITYAAPCWSSTRDFNYNKLQTVQNKALKIAYNTKFRTNLKKLHNKINFPLIKDYIFKLSKKFYLYKNPNHSNKLISSIGRSRLINLRYADSYSRYRLPHHYFLEYS